MDEARKLIRAAIEELKKENASKEMKQAISFLADALVLIDRKEAKNG